MTAAVLSLAVLGLVFGGLLAVASKAFAVEVDPKEQEVLEVLPGANCGACGYPGCAGFAAAVAKGNAPLMGCPVGGAETAAKIAEIVGAENVDSAERKVARVMCQGSSEVAQNRFEYSGLASCKAAHSVSGGHKACTYGCLGLGDCLEACPFGAITMSEGGLPVIDEEKCAGCAKCVAACPRGIIEMVPISKRVLIRCKSLEKGGTVRKACQVGCVACTLCAKNCPKEAIEIRDNLARINYEGCVNCGLCVKKCPMNTIIHLDRQ